LRGAGPRNLPSYTIAFLLLYNNTASSSTHRAAIQNDDGVEISQRLSFGISNYQ